MSIVIIVGIYSDVIVDFSIKSHFIEEANTNIVVFCVRCLDGNEALGNLWDFSQAHNEPIFVVCVCSLTQMNNILFLDPVVGLYTRSFMLQSCIID